MDVLTCMDGKGRFYVNRPISNNLEYTATVEGVNFLARKTLQHFWLAKVSPLLPLLILGHQVFPGVNCLFYQVNRFVNCRSYASLPLEYFEAALDLLGRQCREGEGVGVVGSSKGGDLALALAVTQGPKVEL